MRFMKKNVFDIEKKRAPQILLYSLLLTVFHYTFNYIGVGNASATKTSVLSAFSAFLGVLLAPLFFKTEKITLKKIIGCVFGALGVIIVNLGFFEGSFTFLGEGFVLLATVCNAFQAPIAAFARAVQAIVDKDGSAEAAE